MQEVQSLSFPELYHIFTENSQTAIPYTMRTTLATCLLALLLSGCYGTTSDNSSMYDCGISQELAISRKENIKNPEYNLLFRIPQTKESAVYGNIDIEFDIDAPQ
jgi:hypothetical protein